MSTTMQAATARRYGGPEVMAIETVARPEPGPGQLLIRVAAFGVTRGDARIRAVDVPRGMGLMVRAVFGLTRPRRPIPGREFAGEVAAVGEGRAGWSLGMPVMGITDGMTLGAGAEFCVVSAAGMVRPIPPGLDVTHAAGCLFGLIAAADFLIDQMALQKGERLLVNGGSGAVGAAAVWLGVHLGARVTATASAANHEFLCSLGAAATNDYRDGLPQGPFDAILDVPGTLPYARARPLLTPEGRLGLMTADLLPQLGAAIRPRRGGHRLSCGIVKEKPEALDRALSYLEAGYRPKITILPLSEIVEAHRLASSGHKRGNVVVTLEDAG